ncbi:MAG TPA: hypothetical protein VM840_02700 [Actinomycetota bacterium]|nr:hypothetical protein [Actinomycetota bacterium]
MDCPQCRSTETGTIGFSEVAEGARFHYCRRCEHRWWTARSQTVPLDTILTQVANLPKVS